MQEVIEHKFPTQNESQQAPASCPTSTNTVFGDMSTPAALKALDGFLADKSYMEGFSASQADVAMFDAVPSAPSATLCHLLRWYKHIQSFLRERASLPSAKCQFVLPASASTNAPSDEEKRTTILTFLARTTRQTAQRRRESRSSVSQSTLPRSPRSQLSSPSPPSCWTSSPGTTRRTWPSWRSASAASAWTDCSGGSPSWSRWATASRSSR